MKRQNLQSRRAFLISSALTTASLASGAAAASASSSLSIDQKDQPFNLKYAPHFGMFKNSAGEDLLDQLEFIAERGFRALEDNGMMSRPTGMQNKIGETMSKLGLQMGVFVAYAEFGAATFVSHDRKISEMLVAKMKAAVEVAKRVNASWCTVVPGTFDTGLQWEYQTANVIENLKRCAEVLEPYGLIMVLEPLNPWRDHPGLFLTKIPQAYQICKAVNSPSCKILDDLYHQQITEGNLIPNLDYAWEEIAYFQVGDNPGRKEPTTGEINYLNIFRHLHKKGYQGIIGMEHGNSIKGVLGEKSVIDAYRACDKF